MIKTVIILISVMLILLAITRYIIKEAEKIRRTVEDFLFSFSNATPSQIKGPYISNIRNIINKNMRSMKNLLRTSLSIFVIIITASIALIVFDSREYFSDYFEVQRTKLNLRNEASVDSLIGVINQKELLILENKNSINSLDEKVNKYKSDNYKLGKSNKALTDIIKHQNQMIDRFNKEKITN